MEQFRQRVVLEAMRRTKSGIFVYPSLWIVISVLKDLPNTHWGFWVTNTVIFCTVALIRHFSSSHLASMVPKRYTLARTWFVALALTNPLLWGLLTALAVINPASFGTLQTPMLLAGCGIVAAGTMAYAIDNTMRLSFTALLMVPTAAALLLSPTDDNILVGTLAVVFAIYVTIASAGLGRDYWQSLRVEALLEKKAKELEELSYTDGLTTLRNRRFFDTNFSVEWKRAQRSHLHLAILMIDVDHFKAINDTHGHDVGDFCLREIGKVIAGQLSRSGDIAARFGGEEFVVLLGNTDLPGAQAVAERMLASIRQITIPIGDTELQLRCSIGGCSRVPGTEDPLSMIKEADTLLYRAKRNGRDQALIGFDDTTAAKTDAPTL